MAGGDLLSWPYGATGRLLNRDVRAIRALRVSRRPRRDDHAERDAGLLPAVIDHHDLAWRPDAGVTPRRGATR